MVVDECVAWIPSPGGTASCLLVPQQYVTTAVINKFLEVYGEFVTITSDRCSQVVELSFADELLLQGDVDPGSPGWEWLRDWMASSLMASRYRDDLLALQRYRQKLLGE